MPRLYLDGDSVTWLLREGAEIEITYQGKRRRVLAFNGPGALELEAIPDTAPETERAA